MFAKKHKKSKEIQKDLLRFILEERLTGSSKNKIKIVFDGYHPSFLPERNDNSVNVIFSGEQTADQKIKEIVESAYNPKTIVVVSDDRQIKFFAKTAGAKSLSIEEFVGIDSLAADNGKENQQKKELTYSQVQKINEELRKIWLG